MMNRVPRCSPPTVSLPTFVICVISIALALQGAIKLVMYSFKPVEAPSISEINTEYCLWRMHDTCWTSPNSSLATYELLFPVTRAALFEPQIVQGFQPLETRYDIAVVWNAMTQCRKVHQRTTTPTSDDERTVLFASLPTNASVDAWCGASLLGESGHEPDSVVWLYPSDVMLSPYAAHKTAFLSDGVKRDRQERMKMMVEGLVSIAFASVLFLFNTRLEVWWKSPSTSKTRTSLVVNPLAIMHSASPSDRDGRGEIATTPVDPTWIDLQTPGKE